MKRFLKKLADRAVWLLCPNRCPYCDKLIGYNDTECQECAHELFKGVCSRELPMGGTCTAPFEYSDKVRQALLRYKFHSEISAAGSFAKYVASAAESFVPVIDVVTNVPLSAGSLKKRGYDQSRLLAQKTAGIIHKPYCVTLRKIKQKRIQHSLSINERRENVLGCYAAADNEVIRGKSLLLIDDICTSGYTMAECRRVLLEAGAVNVYCVSAAMAQLELSD